MLSRWNIDFDQALKIAKENLWSISNRDFNKHPSGLYISPYNDTHDASRIFLHDLIWQLPVRGNHVVMIPNRNTLLVAGSDDPQALTIMAGVAQEALQKHERPMIGAAFRLQDSNWVAFLPLPDHPAFVPMSLCRAISNQQWHNEQKGLLDEIHRKEGKDIFVASLKTMRREDGQVYSLTSWVQGVTDTLMPKADVIAFCIQTPPAEKQRTLFADWTKVVQAVSDFTPEPDCYPTRYRVRTFPTPDQIHKINAREKP